MPEFLVLLPKFGNDNLVGISDRLDLEKSVHSLKGDRLSFRDQKVDEGDGKNHKRCKEEIDAISHRQEHLGGESGDDEVPEPVIGCS